MLDELRHEVLRALLALPRAGLVQGTSGNVSGRSGDLIIIKPSGVSYEDLRTEHLVVVNLDGKIVEGDLAPSVDTAAHLEIYQALPEVGGVAHTHSTYATAFAVLGRELPAYTTELADLLGGPVPVSDYVPPGDRGIGVQFATLTRPNPSRALLLRSHGVFTSGRTPEAAVKAAVVVEHAAQVACLAELLGHPAPLPPAEVEALHSRYVSRYGQREVRDE